MVGRRRQRRRRRRRKLVHLGGKLPGALRRGETCTCRRADPPRDSTRLPSCCCPRRIRGLAVSGGAFPAAAGPHGGSIGIGGSSSEEAAASAAGDRPLCPDARRGLPGPSRLFSCACACRSSSSGIRRCCESSSSSSEKRRRQSAGASPACRRRGASAAGSSTGRRLPFARRRRKGSFGSFGSVFLFFCSFFCSFSFFFSSEPAESLLGTQGGQQSPERPSESRPEGRRPGGGLLQGARCALRPRRGLCGIRRERRRRPRAFGSTAGDGGAFARRRGERSAAGRCRGSGEQRQTGGGRVGPSGGRGGDASCSGEEEGRGRKARERVRQ